MKKSICYCGHDCSRCLTYLATINKDDNLRKKSQKFYKDEFGTDVPLEDIHCHSGRSKDVFYLCKECHWIKCCKDRNLNACSDCTEYPCEALKQYQEKYVNMCNQIEQTDTIYKQEITYCGLACVLCSENENCLGCKNGGCKEHKRCKNYNCCREKGIDGCWECEAFPCNEGMLKNLRIRAFARFAKEYGKVELVRCLLRNKEKGIVYHYEGQLIGDYDRCNTEEEIIQTILDFRSEE